jgi:general secretion pathway protein F/type IV pilus assembly protein PilC
MAGRPFVGWPGLTTIEFVATFAYIARDSAGSRVSGTVTATTEQAALDQLQAKQLAPVRVQTVRERMRRRRRVRARHLATAYRQLADLLRAGVPLLRALRLLGKSRSNATLASVMRDIADQVADGERLADAMHKHADVFPPIQVAMVRAGERGAFLDQVLARLGSFLEHQADLRSKVIGNLIYPVLLLFIGATVVTVALVAFVPKFEIYFGRMDLPLPTRILLFVSKVLTSGWPILLAGLIACVAAAWWLLRRPEVKRAVARWQLQVPKLGPLIRSLAVARFARILGTMLQNGIPMLSAMQISRNAAGHLLLAEAIDRAAEAVRAGEPLSKPLAESGLFGEDIVEMISVGESANNLPDVLLTIADTIEARIDRMLTLFLRLMEPLLLFLLAGVVAFIFIALVVPMMRMSTTV